MTTTLIAGLDSVVGINLAAHLAQRSQVVGVSLDEPLSLAGCHTGHCYGQDENDIREWVESIRPERLVYCGPSASSAWDETDGRRPDVESVDIAGRWAAAAREYGAHFTLVSTDAVFTGPWVFHDEDSNCKCQTRHGRAARRIENLCAQQAPEALIVRTNVFGWSYTNGWIERLVAELELGHAGPFDFHRHATPILATDFAEILEKAWEANLDGVYHIAGAERINPNQFIQKLADEFGLPAPIPVDGNKVIERPAEYGCGESSLHTTRIRKALEIGMPTIGDGLQRLREQMHDGFCDGLKTPAEMQQAA